MIIAMNTGLKLGRRIINYSSTVNGLVIGFIIFICFPMMRNTPVRNLKACNVIRNVLENNIKLFINK